MCGRRASNKEVENLQLPRHMLRGELLVHPLVSQQAVDPNPQLGTQVNQTVNNCKNDVLVRGLHSFQKVSVKKSQEPGER